MKKPKIPACFSAKIDPGLADKLKSDLEDQGFSFSKPPHTIFSAIKKGISCTLYESGALTVQGKDKDPFIEFYLEPEILKTFNFTNPLVSVDLTPRIGVDEAGKGDFFGPLSTCAFYADEEGIKKLVSLGVKDSKRFSDSTILKLGKGLKGSFSFSLIRLFPEKYNELYAKFHNLNRLLAWTHAAAILDLMQKTSPKKAVIDQFAEKHVMEKMLKQKNMTIPLEQRHKGEEDVVVAAASIVARMGFLEGLGKLGEDLQLKLPKGASLEVKQTAKKIIEKFGLEMLDKVSKKHFKTRADIIGTL